MRPLIGIPQCLDVQGRWRSGRVYQYADTAYARGVEEAGGTPVYLAIGADPAELVSRIDGLLLPGGDDLLPPAPYPDAVRFELAPAEQVAFDAALIEAATARPLPIFGICYGMQLLALQRGGQLHYDIETDAPGAGAHQLPEDGRHALQLEPESRLASILGSERIEVNSRHHQAVAEVGAGLRVSARTSDGIIEALECRTETFCLGVQWHPEALETAHRRALFGAFVTACTR